MRLGEAQQRLLRDLTLWEIDAPLSPKQHPRHEAVFQAESRKAKRPRRRICLLKGCEQPFVSDDPAERYCGPQCRRKAAKWLHWRRQRKYRHTENGKECRREQSRRNRIRRREREQSGPEDAGRVGNAPDPDSKKVPCARPGCYECFNPHPRSPLQRFCSPLCRKALRRVRLRESRWGLPERKGYNRQPGDPFVFLWQPRSR